ELGGESTEQSGHREIHLAMTVTACGVQYGSPICRELHVAVPQISVHQRGTVRFRIAQPIVQRRQQPLEACLRPSIELRRGRLELRQEPLITPELRPHRMPPVRLPERSYEIVGFPAVLACL